MDAKWGNYNVQMKRVDGKKEGIMMCNLNVRIEKGGHYNVEMKRVDAKGRNMMCKLNGHDG